MKNVLSPMYKFASTVWRSMDMWKQLFSLLHSKRRSCDATLNKTVTRRSKIHDSTRLLYLTQTNNSNWALNFFLNIVPIISYFSQTKLLHQATWVDRKLTLTSASTESTSWIRLIQKIWKWAKLAPSWQNWLQVTKESIQFHSTAQVPHHPHP